MGRSLLLLLWSIAGRRHDTGTLEQMHPVLLFFGVWGWALPFELFIRGLDAAIHLPHKPFLPVIQQPLDESEDLLNRLWSHVARDELAWWQTWEVGDLVMWDNRCTMHKRTAFDPSERRLMHRAQVRGGPPLA